MNGKTPIQRLNELVRVNFLLQCHVFNSINNFSHKFNKEKGRDGLDLISQLTNLAKTN